MMEEMVAVHFKAGETIFKEGDAPGPVYLINQGSVRIVKDRGGESITLANLSFNNIFGEMALIDKKPRSATAIAEKDTWCYKLDEKTFQKKLNELDPFMRGICQVVVRIARDMTEKYPAEVQDVIGAIKPTAIKVQPGELPLIDDKGNPVGRTELPMVE